MTVYAPARRAAHLTAAAILLALTTPGFAQDRFGFTQSVMRERQAAVGEVGADKIADRINDWAYRSGINSTSNSYSAALQFARCVVRFDKAAADRLLVTPIGDPRDRAALVKLVSENRACAGEISSVSPVLLRAALAETALTDRNTATTKSAASVGIPEVVLGYPLLDVARCHVTFAPASVSRLLSTSPGTKAERVAAETLFTSVPQCATTSGLGRIAPTVVRLALVDAAYATRRN